MSDTISTLPSIFVHFSGTTMDKSSWFAQIHLSFSHIVDRIIVAFVLFKMIFQNRYPAMGGMIYIYHEEIVPPAPLHLCAQIPSSQ